MNTTTAIYTTMQLPIQRGRNLLIFVSLLLLQISLLSGQILDANNKITLTLSDGTPVTLYGKASDLSDEPTKEYFYMPTNLRLSQKADGTPQFLYLMYTSEENSEEASGAILHMLMEYGLTPKQERELQSTLRGKYRGAELKGVVDVEPDGDNSIRVISATLTGKRTRTMVMSGKAPVFPGNRIAVAAELDAKGAQLMNATFQETSSITDLSINLSYNYSVRVPAAKGFYMEDWSKMDSLHLLDTAHYSKEVKEEKDYGEKTLNGVVGGLVAGPIGAAIGWFGSGNKKTTKFKYDEMREFYRKLEELGVITVRFEENVDDERVTQIREAFFQHFLNSFAEKTASDDIPTPGKQEKQAMPNIKHGNEYTFRREFAEMIVEKRKRVFNLSYAMAVTKSFQLTENLASWYDGVKDNPKCVGTILLNDPFFQHRDVNVIMDLDAEDMVGTELNYVTVSLRKQRDVKGANDFSHQLTFDRRFFEDNGNRATVTYSKAQDGDPDEYEYKVQWSLRGGNLFPRNDTSWTKGNWQGITLAPPVEPRLIRYEVDLDELQDLEIRNATLQLRYEKFGKEVETNMNISLYSKQPYMEKTIYMDKNTRGYAYRLVFTHKTKGVMATDWDAKINTDYIFAVIPEELRKGDESFIEEMLERGKAVLGGGRDKEVDETQQVLDKFKDVISTN